jgi:hypothetical protein
MMRWRSIVFITVTVGVLLAIALAQGCENRSSGGLGPAATTGTPSPSPSPSTATLAAPATQADAALTVLPATQALPAVDWNNRRYPDPSDGGMILLRNGHSLDGGSPVSLTAVLPARFHGAPAAVVILTRQSGGAPEDLVELFGLATAEPVLLASHASTGTPQASGSWRIVDGAVLREEHTPASGSQPASTTRYTPLSDGGMDETWPGSGTVAGQEG